MTDPRFRLTEAFVAQVYAEKAGKGQEEAEATIRAIWAISMALMPMLWTLLESTERDARILSLRGKNADGRPMTCRIIAQRLDLDPRTVFRRIRTHTKLRRAALKIAI